MKTSPQILVTPELKPFLGQVIGWVKVNQTFIDHNANYECAAWWKDSEIQLGVYPMILEENHLYPRDLRLHVKYDAVVVDDYFPALWGGVSVSKSLISPSILGKRLRFIADMILLSLSRRLAQVQIAIWIFVFILSCGIHLSTHCVPIWLLSSSLLISIGRFMKITLMESIFLILVWLVIAPTILVQSPMQSESLSAIMGISMMVLDIWENLMPAILLGQWDFNK